jgi:hypothetical protein
MDSRPLPIRRLVAYARPECFADNTCAILDRLGCKILTPKEFEQDACDRDAPSAAPDLYLVEPDRIAELPDPAPGRPGVVLLTKGGMNRVEDARIVGSVRSPVGVHDLYRLLQQLLEEHPRSTPRLETTLRATCREGGREWSARVVSLSENGCLLRSDETVALGAALRLAFEMPSVGRVHVRAEAAYQIKSELGLVFSSTSADIRNAISGFVTRSLLAAAAAANPATDRASG